MSNAAKVPLNGPRKAAILIVLLGDEAAASIYNCLPKDTVRAITREIAELEHISAEAASKVLLEYARLIQNEALTGQGGQACANRLLTKAFGAEGARAVLSEARLEGESSTQELDTLQRSDPQQLAKFIQGEHPQTIALVLAHLHPRVARNVLMRLPESIRAQAVKRLAEMQQFSPDMVTKIAMVLHKRLLEPGQQHRPSYGGVKAVADLLNQIDSESTRNILETIEEGNVQLAGSIRNLMFTFEDLLEVQDVGMRELLGQVGKRVLSIALKGASEDLRNHFFQCMSPRAVEMMKEDMEALGPLRSWDVNAAQQEVVRTARQLEGEGKMVLKAEQGESYVV
jgi:flagellar motor switch protein FliG